MGVSDKVQSISPKRVLHVVGSMNVGGVETWLMQILRHADPRRLSMDFLVHTAGSCDYEPEILARGCRMLRCTTSQRSPAYPFHLGRMLRNFGPYDVVHSHIHHCSAYVLWVAQRVGVPCRIAHSHTDSSCSDSAANWTRRLYLKVATTGMHRHATHWIGASSAAGESLFGDEWLRDSRHRILHCGIDLAPFRQPSERARLRSKWNLSEREFVIVHVGRFDAAKNHEFLARVAAEVVQRRPLTRLLLVGDGDLRPGIEQQMTSLGIGGKAIFAGTRADVPQLLGAADAMVFPSLREGLGLALVEAQAAGLPCVISDVIPREADVVPALIHRISLTASPATWAETVLAAARDEKPRRADALSSVENSQFNVVHSVEELYALYAA